ncbi:MAG TPA: alanine--tRNA ligase-related protein, partial [Dehalococcoidia bacterium]|nr:alanine--tRNA ligase-related protein [Dehalococcoidia bacterium]
MIQFRASNRGKLTEFWNQWLRNPFSAPFDLTAGNVSPFQVSTQGTASQQFGEEIADEVFVDRLNRELAEFAESRGIGPDPITDEQEQSSRNLIAELAKSWENTLFGHEAFYLSDTYGFPYELTEEIAAEHGLTVDRAGFEREKEAQRERARAAQKGAGRERETFLDYDQLPLPESAFLGYQTLTAEARVESIATPDGSAEEATEGQEIEVVLDRTPFYAESGGQVGDQGVIQAPSGSIRIVDTYREGRGLIVHRGIVEQGGIAVGEQVTARVDLPRRADIARKHTGTHLLHAALRKVLGTHVHQAGSLVTPDRLRFDFTHIAAVTKEEIAEVQRLVNQNVREDWPVHLRTASYQQAIDEGALAFFDEKYGEVVRIVEVQPPENDRPHRSPEAHDGGPFSKELCGGTHCATTGEVGFVYVVSESSVGAGMRRIEAVTGRAAEELLRQRLTALEEVGRQVGAPVPEVPAKVSDLLQSLEQERKRAQGLQRELNRRLVDELLADVSSVDGVKLLSARVAAPDFETLREMADLLRDRVQSGVIVLGAVFNQRPNFLAVVTKDLVAKGYNAGALVKEVASLTGGSGGGRPELAQAGGRDASKLDQALQRVPALLREHVSK